MFMIIIFYYFVLFCSGSENNDLFNTIVTFHPSNYVSEGSIVKMQCDFNLQTQNNDLRLLYWETTNGKRLFTYDHKNKNNTKIHDGYSHKIQGYNYIEYKKSLKRRHWLTMNVNISDDGITYKCLVLDDKVFNEGSNTKKLHIFPSLYNCTGNLILFSSMFYVNIILYIIFF